MAFFFFLAVYACEGREENFKENFKDTRTEMSEITDREYQEPPSWEGLKDYDYDQKETALKEYSQALDALNRKIESLQAQVDTAGAEINHNVKESWKEDLENLRQRKSKLEGQYHRMETAGSIEWENAQASFEDGWNKLRPRWEGVRAE